MRTAGSAFRPDWLGLWATLLVLIGIRPAAIRRAWPMLAFLAPIIAAMPADITITPRLSNSSIWQPTRLANIDWQIISAIGLRHVLPVHTNNTNRLAKRSNVSWGTTPTRRISISRSRT